MSRLWLVLVLALCASSNLTHASHVLAQAGAPAASEVSSQASGSPDATAVAAADDTANLAAEQTSAEVAPAPEETPQAPRAPGKVRLSVHTRPGITLYVWPAGSRRYERVCSDHCRAKVPPGDYYFGLSRYDAEPIPDLLLHHVAKDSRVEGVYRQARGARIAGGILLVTGLLSAAGGLGLGLPLVGDHHLHSVGVGVLSAGLVTGGVLALVGAILMSRDDEAYVSVQAFKP